MKKLRFIFIFVFLSGMIFTVFQYIPVLEEETQSHAKELSKKGAEDDNCDDDTDEVANEGNDAIYDHKIFNFNHHSLKVQLSSALKNDYYSFFQKINIPPPKQFNFSV